MRILQITSHLDVGGVTSHVLALAEALARRGYEVAVASDAGRLAPPAGVAHWRVPLHTSAEFGLRAWRAAQELAGRLQEHPVDLVHAHTRVAHVAADRLSRRLRVPYVTTWHGFFRPNLGRRLWPCHGDAAIAVSEPVRAHVTRDLRFPADRVHVIPHGIQAERFEQPVDPAARQRLRDSAHLPPEARIIGTVARLVPSKGVGQLIESLVHVRAAIPAACLLIVGDGPERARLQQAAEGRGVGDAVRFTGALPETRAALSLMEVFVFLPAVQEGFGLSLLEAMAAARPIVAVRRGGGSTWVLDRDPVGLLVDPDNPQALASSIVRVLQDPPLAGRMGQDARALVKRRYGFEQMISAIETVYKDVAHA